MKKTDAEIQLQIEGLKKMKDNLPKFSVFGDNNHAPIDAQISVLEGKRKADYYYEDETSDEYNDGDNEVYFAAEKAEEWLNGKIKEDLFEPIPRQRR